MLWGKGKHRQTKFTSKWEGSWRYRCMRYVWDCTEGLVLLFTHCKLHISLVFEYLFVESNFPDNILKNKIASKKIVFLVNKSTWFRFFKEIIQTKLNCMLFFTLNLMIQSVGKSKLLIFLRLLGKIIVLQCCITPSI